MPYLIFGICSIHYRPHDLLPVLPVVPACMSVEGNPSTLEPIARQSVKARFEVSG